MKNYGIGNTFPTSLIRRTVTIRPIDKDFFDKCIKSYALLHSYWGHANTIAAANQFLGVDVTPPSERRAIVLDAVNLPTLDGVLLDCIVVVSPTYVKGYRPAEGEVSSPDKILDWQLLLVEFI